MSNELKVFTKSIADALREKKGKTGLINPQDFTAEIASIQTKEDLDAELNEQDALLASLKIQVDNLDEMNLATKTVNKNGTYNASDDGVDGWSSIVVEVVGNQNVEIALPSVFVSATEIYYVATTDDKILISSDSNNCGLWLYTISTNTMTQVYSSGARWKWFQQVTDTKWLIGYDYILVYDSTNDSVTQIHNSYAYANVFQQVTDTKWLLCSAEGNTRGMLLYNSSNDTVVKLYSEGYGWKTYQQINKDKWIIGANNNSTPSLGVFIYDASNDTFTRVYENYSYWRFGKVNENLCLLGSSASNSGVFIYNATDNTVSQIYSAGRSWYYFKQINEHIWLISSNDSSATGFLKFDLNTQTITQISTSGYRCDVYQQINDEKWLICGGLGVYLYNVTTDTITTLYTNYQWTNVQMIGTTKCLIGSFYSSSTGVLVYDETTDTISKKYSTNYGWTYFQPIGTDRCLIGSSYGSATTSSGLLLYDVNADTIRKIFSTGFAYDTFVLDDNNCYVSSSNKTESKLTLYYNADTNTIELRSFYLGEV